MLAFNTSGQALFFTLNALQSGTLVTGASGQISGSRHTLAGPSGMQAISGFVVEDGIGMYHAHLYDWDTSGSFIGFLFTASGCAPVSFSTMTTLAVSGVQYPASGIWPASGATVVAGAAASGTTFLASGTQVLVYSGQLSGQPIAGLSGLIYTASGVWPASGAFVNATATVNSGLFVTVPIASISGTNVVVPTATLSGVVANSGLFVTVPVATISGINIASGQSVNVFSGQLSGQPVAGLSGQIYTASGIWPASGATVVAGAAASGTTYLASGQLVGLLSGQTVSVYSGQLSGQPIAGLSGLIYTASGIWPASGAFVNATATVNSGLFVTVPISSISGVNVVAAQGSGTTFLASGQSVYLYSGQIVSVYSGQLSGQPIAGLSGFIYTASGIWPASGAFVNATATVNSGLFVTVPISSISGVNVVAAQGSGTTFLASGQSVYLYSGQSVQVYSGQLSGQPIAGLSGFIYHASGTNATVPPASISGNFVTVPIATISGNVSNSGLFVSVPTATLSGVVANSGLFTTVPVATLSGIQPISGTFVSVPISSISGVNVVATAASGLFVTVPIASISGVNAVAAAPASGTTYLASGSIFQDLMKESMSNVTGEAVHSLLNALRKLTNRWDTTTNSGFLTVFKEDAVTQAYTQALTAQSGANPVTGLGDA